MNPESTKYLATLSCPHLKKVSTKTSQHLSDITIATENGVPQHLSKFHTNINLCSVFKVCGAAPILCTSKCQNFSGSSFLGQQLTVWHFGSNEWLGALIPLPTDNGSGLCHSVCTTHLCIFNVLCKLPCSQNQLMTDTLEF